MKKFFVQDVKTAGKNSAGIFIFANLNKKGNYGNI